MGRRRGRKGGGEAALTLAVVTIGLVGAALQWLAENPAAIVVIAAVGGGLVALHTRAAKARAQSERRAFVAVQLANEKRILDDCVRICRETKNTGTRASRARLGLQHVESLRAAAALDAEEAGRLERYFKAMEVIAPALEAFARGAAAGTDRTRSKRFAEARTLAKSAGVTDEMLRDADVVHPTTNAPLTVADLLGDDTAADSPDDVVMAEPLEGPTPTPSGVRFTISFGGVTELQPPHAADARWVPAGEPVQIGGREIPGGLLWVGSTLPSVSRYGNEPALIDPSLPVDDRRPDIAGEAMPYWPSYGDIDPRCRGAYLAWLAGGRNGTDIGLGYVFLFYYGLERRLLDDVYREQVTTDEVVAIRGEIERLLNLHPRGSFVGYASEFLDYIDGRWQLPELTFRTGGRPRRYTVPLGVRVALGRAALSGDPMRAELALAWIRSHSSPGLGPAASVCAAEFDALFLRSYAETFGAGMVLKPNKARIEHQYRPASASFGGREVSLDLDLPDPTLLTRPWNRLHAIADRCCEDLDPFRRLVARRPEARGGPEGYAILPADLATVEPPALTALRTWAEEQLATGDIATTEASSLMRLWKEAGGDFARPRPTAVAVAQVLGRWGIGIEPDARFGGPPIKLDGRIVLFRNPAPAPNAPTDAYSEAATASQLCAVFAMADGHLQLDEVRALDRHLAIAPNLDDSERRRLLGHFHWSLEKPPSIATLSRRLRELSPKTRATMADLVLRLVTDGGHVDPAEVKLLARLYKALDLDPGRVHADIHRVITGDRSAGDDPAVVRAATQDTGYVIPSAPGPTGAVALDHARIRQRVEESARVATMLGTIFADEEAPPPVPTPAPADGTAIAGLDAAHSALLRKLGGARSISRTSFESLAADTNVLPDGAIEALNDAAFAVVDAPLLEGDDPIEVDPQVLEVMLS
jgi:hypothetical protein